MAGFDVADEYARIMKKGGKLMQLAETKGMQAANRRGLKNSTMAVGAVADQQAQVALPMASQNVETETQRRGQDLEFDARNRAAAADMAAKINAGAAQEFAGLQANPGMPATQRHNYYMRIRGNQAAQLANVKRLFGYSVKL